MNHDFQVGVHKPQQVLPDIRPKSFSPADEPLTIFLPFPSEVSGNSVSIYLFQNDHVFFVSGPCIAQILQ